MSATTTAGQNSKSASASDIPALAGHKTTCCPRCNRPSSQAIRSAVGIDAETKLPYRGNVS